MPAANDCAVPRHENMTIASSIKVRTDPVTTSSATSSVGCASAAQAAAMIATPISRPISEYRGIGHHRACRSRLSQFPPQLLFHAFHLRFQSSAVAAAEVEFGGAGDAVAIDRHGFQAAAQHAEHLIQVPFN